MNNRAGEETETEGTILQRHYKGCPFAEACFVARYVEADRACWHHLRVIPLERGETLFRPGSPAVGCYVLCRGRIKLTYPCNGRTLGLGIAHPGQLLGKEFFCDAQYRTRAQALEPSWAVYFDQDRLRATLQAHPEVNLWLLEELAKHCKALYHEAVERAYHPAEERLVGLLRSLHSQLGPRIPLSQTELAQMLGVGRDTVNRCLQGLEREGRVEIGRREIRLRPSFPF